MEKREILEQMKHHHAEYARLAEELAALEGPEKKAEFERFQRARLEKFKTKYTVEATKEAKPIDWADVEAKIFTPENIEANTKRNPEGWCLCYDSEGMACLGVGYYGGGNYFPLAYDAQDAERFLERQSRKRRQKENR